MMKLFLRRLFIKVATTRTWQWILTWVIPSIRFSRTIHLNDKAIAKIISILKEGDCLLVRDPMKFSNILIGGRYSHAGICISMDYAMPVIGEMGHAGYQELNLVKFLGYARHVVVLRPKNYTTEYGAKMAIIARRKGLMSKGYDFVFKFDEKTLYCSELVFVADVERRYRANTQDLAGLGHHYISPDGLYKAKGAKILLEIRNEKT